MVSIRPIEAQRSIDVGGVPNTRVDGSVGQGLQALGGAVSQTANVLASIDQRRAEMKAQADDFRADQGFRRLGDDMSLEFAKQQQGIDPSGEGFTDQVSGKFNEKAEEFLKTVPTEFRGKFQELVRTSRTGWIDKAAAAEIDQRNSWYRDGITKAQQGLQGQVFNDPSIFDAALSDGNRAIESSGLPPVEKEKLKEAWKNTLAQTVGERDVRNAEADPGSAADASQRLGVSGTDPVHTVVAKIIGAESGGDANAKNPNSSASGVGQFINSTWLSTVKKYRPDIAAGKSDREILALKSNPALGREMTTRLTQQNAHDLASAGLPVTPGTLYLAHFAGIGGARAVLRAGDGASVADVLGPEVTKANGFLNGKTVGWLKGWADKKMGGATPSAPSDPRYASLPLADRLKIYDQIQAAAQRGQTAIDAQTKATYETEKGSLQLGIQTGAVSSPVQIMQSGMSDADKAGLLSALRTRQGDNANVAESVRLFGQGALSVDPYDSKGKKTVNDVWGAVSKTAPPEQLQQTAEELVRQTGVVPQPVVNEIRKGISSGNAQVAAQAAQAAQRFATVDPSALSRTDGGSEVQKAADDFSYYVNSLNMSPEDAAKKIMALRDPEKQRERKAMEPAAKEFVKQMQDVDIASAFDDSLLGWRSNPSLGVTPQQELGIKADFLAIAENEFYDANGDPEIAKNRALEQMKRLYGVSDISGSKVVMKHPPENYWPADVTGGGSPAPIGDFEGLKERGNIDLANRPMVQNKDGSVSTVRSMSFEEDGQEVLVPTVSPDGRLLSDDEAIDLYHQTGQFLGKFDTPDHADAYAQALHSAQDRYYLGGGSGGPYGYVKDQIYDDYKDLFPDSAIAQQYHNLVGADDKANIDSIRRQWMENNMAIVSTPTTDAMVKRGEMPAYSVLFKDFNGVWQTLPGKLFQLDAKPIQKQRIDAARDSQTLNRNVIEGVPAELQGAGMQNNPLMSTDPNAVNPAPESFWRIPSRKDVQNALHLQMPTPAGQISDQRQQLFDDARQNGTLPGAP